MLSTGNGRRDIVFKLDALQLPIDPTTEYDVLAVGVTTILVVVAPLLHR
jgi:hypothetical protein